MHDKHQKDTMAHENAHATVGSHPEEGAARKQLSGFADGLIKIASTLSGGVSLALAAAVFVPSAPALTGAAAIVGLVGSGLLVRKYG
ncbi:hypothetical protein [Cupriavidus plantarum]|uniref:hypothetical protein n=1 Tax=Cupriavidus plantarum TaxID=942865 RepID=UPI000E238A85|nr:hypothetical protein [Cupriavidus plantarum]REF01891.1 hypothetical protein C7418_0676 [Cupriavidus plantarum]